MSRPTPPDGTREQEPPEPTPGDLAAALYRELETVRAVLRVDRARRAGVAPPDDPAEPADADTELLAEVDYYEGLTVWAHRGDDWWRVNANGRWFLDTARRPHDGDLQPLGVLGRTPSAARDRGADR